MPNGHIAPVVVAKSIGTILGSASTNTYIWPNTTGKTVSLEWIAARFTSDATVGNRQIRMYLLTDADVEVRDTHAGAVQAASLTRHYDFSTGIYRETAFVDGAIQVPFPMKFYVPSGWKIKIADSANISVADTLPLVSLQYEEVNG